jgi:hypothetical protein
MNVGKEKAGLDMRSTQNPVITQKITERHAIESQSVVNSYIYDNL